MRLCAVGEDTLMLYLGESADAQTLARVQTTVTAIEQILGDDLVDLVPAYASVLIVYRPLQTPLQDISRRLREGLTGLATAPAQRVDTGATGRTVILPVYYAPETGIDLAALAARAQLSIAQVIALHCAREYRVYAIGFAPGFAYLGQVDERIAAPRLATPRAVVPRGSVAIADRQSAVYPAESPGGWNLIGRCPVPMFSPEKAPYMPVAVGDTVRFEPVDRERYLALGGALS